MILYKSEEERERILIPRATHDHVAFK